MAYYQDLTPYSYCGTTVGFEGSVNIGWLDRSHDYPKGRTSKLFATALLRFCEILVNPMRGIHGCGFCGSRRGSMYVSVAGQELRLGFAEIRVFGRSRVYASPNLVYHYVVEHKYKPPREFVEAVIHGPQPSTDEYLSLLKETGLPFWPLKDSEALKRKVAACSRKSKARLAELMADQRSCPVKKSSP